MPYWTCPNCGANLDVGERCDCQEVHHGQRYDIPMSTWKLLVRTVGTMKEAARTIATTTQNPIK